MKVPLQLLLLKGKFWRLILCPIGIHGPKQDAKGNPANFCGYCGHSFRSDAEVYSTYRTTLVTGEEVVVKAINEHHACSLVIYGGQTALRCTNDNDVVMPLGEVKVHPNNIVHVVKIFPEFK